MAGGASSKLGRAAAAVERLAVDNESYAGTPKDASHAAFYAGAAKGFVSALEGVLLFVSRSTLRTRLKGSLSSTASLQAMYAAIAIGIFLFLRDPADDFKELAWSLSRWGRVVTLIVTFVLDRRMHATDAMFFDALEARNPQFAAAVRDTERKKKTTRDKLLKLKRVAKMTGLRAAGAIVGKLFPGGKFIAIPALKYVSMRPTLGGAGAAAVAAVHALPDSWLSQSHIDDLLLSVSEAVMDADDLGLDAVRPYLKRLQSEQAREYFIGRYRGYLCGMGFLYSVLQAIPFLGIPILLVSECGAAITVIDIVERNLVKDNRMPLCGESALQRDVGVRGGVR